MIEPNTSKNSPQNPNSEEDKTVDARDLVSKSGFQKEPREIVENPAVTPQMIDESSDSQVGFETNDRSNDES